MCLGNTSGKLRVGYDFYKTTKDCKVKKNWLKCKAQDPNGKWHKTKYNLNFVIYFMIIFENINFMLLIVAEVGSYCIPQLELYELFMNSS